MKRLKRSTNRLQRCAARLLIALGISAAYVTLGEVHPASATGTAAGTTITNTSTASYQDALANTYGTNSNTVSIIVQNAPSMTWATVTPTQIVAPGQTVTDTYTITNTGNAAGDFQLTAAPTITGSNVSSYTYSTAAANGGAAYSGNSWTGAGSLNTALAGNQIPVGSSINVSIVYVLSASATVSQTVVTDLTGTITYPATTTPYNAVQISTASSATSETDTVFLDALLNLQLTVTQLTTTLSYSLAVADGSATWAAKDSAAVHTFLGGSPASGVFITMKVPQFNSLPLALTTAVSMTPGAVANGYSNVPPTYTYYYTTVANGSSGWVAQSGLDSGAYYVGVLISGGSCKNGGAATATGYEVCPPTSTPVSTFGSVSNPAYTMTFATAQPSGTGAGVSGVLSGIIGNGLIDNNATAPLLVGPNISTTDSGASISSLTTSGYGIGNTSAGSSSISGASNTQSSQATPLYTVSNGPLANPLATGSYDGLSNDYTHNFTAMSFLRTGDKYTTTNAGATYAPTTGSTTSAAVSGIAIENTIENTGNNNDTYTFVPTAPTSPSGWTVSVKSDSGGNTGTLGASASTITSVTVNSGASYNYWTVYSAPAGVPYLSESVATIKVTSANSAPSATTANLLYAGFVALTTSFTIPGGSTGCPSGVTPAANTACPGGTINYTIDYRNIIGLSNYATTVSSVPAVSFANVMTKAGTFTITSDGTNGTSLGNTWAYATIGGVLTAVTNGPTAAPVDTLNGSNTTFAYYTGSTGGSSVGSTWQTGVSKFIATIGSSTFQLVPYGNASGANTQGTITFSVIVK